MFKYLTLALLMARIDAHDINPPFPADHFASRAARVYGRFNLHLYMLYVRCYSRLVIRALPPYGSSLRRTLSPTNTLIRCSRILPAR